MKKRTKKQTNNNNNNYLDRNNISSIGAGNIVEQTLFRSQDRFNNNNNILDQNNISIGASYILEL